MEIINMFMKWTLNKGFLIEEKKHFLKPLAELNVYFRKKSIDSIEIDTINVGTVTISKADVIVCSHLFYLNKKAKPYFQKTLIG